MAEENPNWFTKKKVQEPRTVFVVDEIKCTMCDFKVQPKTSDIKKIKWVEEEIMIPHAKTHTIEEFYKIWEEDEDEIYDGFSFERNLFSTTKSHHEKTGEFWERVIYPRIEPGTAITLCITLIILMILSFSLW